MSAITKRSDANATSIERVLVSGDLAGLTPEQRVTYYKNVCESIGLNPLTQPFDYIQLNNKLRLYAKRDAADQLRKINGVSVEITRRDVQDGLCFVEVTATDKTGRKDADLGVTDLGNLKGEARANAILKAITKAKRRVTLSICGLGWLDETEVETVPGAVPVPHAETPTLEGEAEGEEEVSRFDQYAALIRETQTLAELTAVGAQVRKADLYDSEKKQLREIFNQRRDEIKASSGGKDAA